MADHCNHNCGSCGASCGSRPSVSQTPEEAAPPPLSRVKRVIGIAGGKGGVGKSLVASMLAVSLRREGGEVAILDADITGPSIPGIFGLTGGVSASAAGLFPAVTETGIKVMSLDLVLERKTDPVLWRGPVAANIVRQFWSDVIWGEVDFMLADLPAGTGDVPLAVFQSLPLDGVILVASPQKLVSAVAAKAVNMARLMNVPVLGLVENYSYYQCPCCGERRVLFGAGEADPAAELELPLLARLPLRPELAELCDRGRIEEGSFPELAELTALLTR